MDTLNSSKIIIGLSSLLVGLGSKYLFGDINKKYEFILEHPISKYFVILIIVFLSTRDLALSAGITMLIFTIFQLVLNGPLSMALHSNPSFYTRPLHMFHFRG